MITIKAKVRNVKKSKNGQGYWRANDYRVIADSKIGSMGLLCGQLSVLYTKDQNLLWSKIIDHYKHLISIAYFHWVAFLPEKLFQI